MSKHADIVLAAISSPDPSSLTTSWRRSVERHRLHPDESVAPGRDSAALKESLERDAALVAVAAPYLKALWDTASDPTAAIFLADATGLILDCLTDRAWDCWGRSAACYLGTRCGEATFGTCGIGTCLAEDRALLFAPGEHFLTFFAPYTVAAVPISGPDGKLVGTIVYSSTEASTSASRLVLLATIGFARRISIELLAAAHPGRRLVLAVRDGCHPDAVLAVDNNDYVHGATRSARRLLGLSDAKLANPISLRDLHENEIPAPAGDLASNEARLIAETMGRFNGNRVAVAKALGISRSTLYRKLASDA